MFKKRGYITGIQKQKNSKYAYVSFTPHNYKEGVLENKEIFYISVENSKYILEEIKSLWNDKTKNIYGVLYADDTLKYQDFNLFIRFFKEEEIEVEKIKQEKIHEEYGELFLEKEIKEK